jgi:hypothetical protein
MFQKAFLILSASAILGAGVLAATAALAQFPGPPPLPGPAGPPPGLGGPPPGLGGPPPQLGLGGPPRAVGPAGTAPRPLGAPSDFARLGGASGFHGLDRAIQGSGRHFQGRTAGYPRAVRAVTATTVAGGHADGDVTARMSTAATATVTAATATVRAATARVTAATMSTADMPDD